MRGQRRQGRGIRVWTVAVVVAIASAAIPATVSATQWGAFVLPINASLSDEHDGPVAVPLPSGDILVAGGYTTPDSGPGTGTDAAEVYELREGVFKPTANRMTSARNVAAAASLGDGRVLIAGGATGGEPDTVVDTAELFDPTTWEFTETGSMAVARWDPFAVSLPDGRVMVGGGREPVLAEDGLDVEYPLSSTTEIYDPSTGEFNPGPSMVVGRSGAGAAALPDGRVIVIGGASGPAANTSEIYDPATGAFAPGPATPVNLPTVTALKNGRLLLVGPSSFFEYDPRTEAFSDTGVNSAAYQRAALAPLPGGRVLLAGHKEAWLFVPAALVVGEPIDFGEVPAGQTSGPEQLTITNEGSQGVEIYSASLTGPDASAFEIVADSCSGKAVSYRESIWSPKSCEIQVTVTPAAAGHLSAAIELSDNSVGSPQSFALSATAVTAGGQGSPAGTGGSSGAPFGGAAASTFASGPAEKKQRRSCAANNRKRVKTIKSIRCLRRPKGRKALAPGGAGLSRLMKVGSVGHGFRPQDR